MDIGLYHLNGHGFESSVPDQTHYLSFFNSISDITLFNDLYINLRPQIYYSKIDDIHDFYAATSIAFGMRGIPITVSSTINKVIDMEITNTAPLWNISLKTSFRF